MTTPVTVTPAHLQAAFTAMAWAGWTYTAAMADPLRARLVRARAAQLATAQFTASHQRTARLVRRFNPAKPAGQAWTTQRVPGAWAPEPALFSATTTATTTA